MAGCSHLLPSSVTATNKQFLYLVLTLITVTSASAYRSHVDSRTIGFDLYHRFSDTVKDLLPLDGFPEEESVHYYSTMVHRDRAIQARRLADWNSSSILTFDGSNETIRVSSLGFLHYVNISIGTPVRSFLVALDTGSDLFWLPCDCTSCVSSLRTPSGNVIKLNIYSPKNSTSSSTVSCSDSLCTRKESCFPSDECPFQVQYLSQSTASYGYLVKDNLHLVEVDSQPADVTAKITLGCARELTGAFLEGGAPNGLFGLGMSGLSVPSILAREGLVYNSFSMCFGPEGIGKLFFGDAGSLDQAETPFILDRTHPTYNVSVTQVSVGAKNVDLSFSAIFDSGTSFTYLNDPAYSSILNEYASLVTDQPISLAGSELPFKYCYQTSSKSNKDTRSLVLTMYGGAIYNVPKPVMYLSSQGKVVGYCIAIIKSDTIDIIGQNFMEGYRVVFDRERNVLGWKAGNCSEGMRSISAASFNASSRPTATPVDQTRKSASRSTGDSHQLLPMICSWLLGALVVIFHLLMVDI